VIFGIGTDIVQVVRIRESLDRHGERFAERILSDAELAEFRASAHPARFLARRFAAKEAVAKAFGTGFSGGLTFRDITIGHDDAGKPELYFENRASDFCRESGIGERFVSISDEKDYAVAFVTLLREIL
jgi:holo-[acyl-carrier protein] synthase